MAPTSGTQAKLPFTQCVGDFFYHVKQQQTTGLPLTDKTVRAQALRFTMMLERLNDDRDTSASDTLLRRANSARFVQQMSWGAMTLSLLALLCGEPPKEGEEPGTTAYLILTGLAGGAAGVFYSRSQLNGAITGRTAALQNEAKREEVISSCKTLQFAANLLLKMESIDSGAIDDWRTHVAALEKALRVLQVPYQEDQELTEAFAKAFEKLSLQPQPPKEDATAAHHAASPIPLDTPSNLSSVPTTAASSPLPDEDGPHLQLRRGASADISTSAQELDETLAAEEEQEDESPKTQPPSPAPEIEPASPPPSAATPEDLELHDIRDASLSAPVQSSADPADNGSFGARATSFVDPT